MAARGVLSALGLAAAVAVALSRALFSATIAAGEAAPGAVPVPDFSGIWAHLSLPGFESPLTGPGPVTNRARRNGVSDAYRYVGDFTNPILKPEAAEIVKRFGEISMTGMPYPSPSNQCWPGGVPYVFWNMGMQLIQRLDQVWILYDSDHEVRRVRLNASHPARVVASWYGDSVGHYEGDTLVIDTVGIKAGPFAMVDFYGTPHSDALHVVERYRFLDHQAARQAEERGLKENRRIQASDTGLARDPNEQGNGLQLLFTVEDEAVFTTPWSATITYQRPLGAWPEFVCAENPHEYFGGRSAAVPTADRPDF